MPHAKESAFQRVVLSGVKPFIDVSALFRPNIYTKRAIKRSLSFFRAPPLPHSSASRAFKTTLQEINWPRGSPNK
jgi:hypothetical protein